MKLMEYLYDRKITILINILSTIVIYILLKLFNTNKLLIFFIISFLIVSYLVPTLYDFFKKRSFYNKFRKTLDNLDKKYLITEVINQSNSLDSKLLLEYLYEIDKSMHEEINNYKYISNELKEYIELWCHEIKTPIATSKLVIENNNNIITQSILEEIEHIELFVEQVLFYSRSDTLEKDYIISEVNLKDVVDTVLLKNKKAILNKKIKIQVNELNTVKSDSKWLEFIINQIIGNSIKYSKDKNSIIEINTIVNKNNTILTIKDNGIGINEIELEKVFDKGFTGSNGRKKYNSTGIGLYLCKKLVNKMGHDITIESIVNEYTIVSIVFPSNSMINLTEM